MNTKDFWKIFNADKSVMILTDCPNTFKDGDGVYYLMKRLQQIYGAKLCGSQKFDDRFDRIEDFDTILKIGFNLDGNRLISAHLFEYDKKENSVRIDLGRGRMIVQDYEYTYQIRKTIIRAIDGWNGLRRFIVESMGDDSPWRTWGDAQFGRDFMEKYIKVELSNGVEIDTDNIREMLQRPFDAEKMVEEAMQNKVYI